MKIQCSISLLKIQFELKSLRTYICMIWTKSCSSAAAQSKKCVLREMEDCQVLTLFDQVLKPSCLLGKFNTFFYLPFATVLSLLIVKSIETMYDAFSRTYLLLLLLL